MERIDLEFAVFITPFSWFVKRRLAFLGNRRLRVDRCPHSLYKTATSRLGVASIPKPLTILDTTTAVRRLFSISISRRCILTGVWNAPSQDERWLGTFLLTLRSSRSAVTVTSIWRRWPSRLAQNGDQVILLGNVAVDRVIRDERSVAPCFRFWCDTRLETPEQTRQAHEQALRDDLLAMTREFQVDDSDVVVINTLRHWPMRGVVDWLEALPARRRPKTALILHFTAFPDQNRSEGWERFYHEAFDRIEKSVCRDKIVLMADSEQLISEYSLMNPGLHFRLAPVPHAKIHGSHGQTLARINAGEKLRIGYVGEARVEQGLRPPSAIARPRPGSRAHRLDRVAHPRLLRRSLSPHFTVKHGAACAIPRYSCITIRWTTGNTANFCARLDVIALPYTTENYHSQTSGVFAEAMASGKIVVVPKGTWLSTQLQRYGGGVAFNPVDCEDFAAETLRIVREPLRYARIAAERAVPVAARFTIQIA